MRYKTDALDTLKHQSAPAIQFSNMQNTSILIVALVALFAITEALPTTGPIRVRRQVLGGSLTSNPAGGADARLDLTKGIGNPNHNVVGQVFAAGNTQSGPVTTGGTLAYNK